VKSFHDLVLSFFSFYLADAMKKLGAGDFFIGRLKLFNN
jgi:hypothetical protein